LKAKNTISRTLLCMHHISSDQAHFVGMVHFVGIDVLHRTAEFYRLVGSLSSQGDAVVAGSHKFRTPQHQSEINVWSSEMGAQIHQTSLRVQELRKMARKKGIFNSGSGSKEVQQLTYEAQRDIKGLEQQIAQFERRVQVDGGAQNCKQHLANMVKMLKQRWMDVAREFKEALDDRSQSLEQQESRRRLYTPVAAPWPPAVSDSVLESGSGPGRALVASLGYASARAEAVEQVQKHISEIAQLFQKMAAMVTEQEESIQDISDDVEKVGQNVSEGNRDLVKVWHHLSSDPSLILKVFAILAFFVVFFVVFLS